MPKLEELPFDNKVSAKYENCKKQITDITLTICLRFMLR